MVPTQHMHGELHQQASAKEILRLGLRVIGVSIAVAVPVGFLLKLVGFI